MYDILFEPIQIGSVKIKNRFVMPAMDSSTTTCEHQFSKQSIDYLAARAKGGFGLIISEFMAVRKNGLATPNQVGIYDDSFIENLSQLTNKIHQYGGKCAAQIHHAGHQTNCVEDVWSVSQTPSLKFMDKVHMMSRVEIYELINDFIEAAVRAKKAGFDMVEVHGAHGYLIAQFFSKACNNRCDEFGGSYENRARFACEVIKGIKQKCGKDFPVIIRISAEEYLETGNNIEDAMIYAMFAEKAGADAIHLSTGSAAGGNIVTTFYQSPGFNAKNAEQVKKCVNIPVICVGRVNSPIIAEKIIRSKQADMISLGRQSVSDSEFPNKVLENRIDEIYQCTGCMQRCYYSPGYDKEDKGISCMLNPFSGKEEKLKMIPSKIRKNIMIVGGGVAGMQVAWILAKRGHSVDLYEKSTILGGQYILAAIPPHKQDYAKAIYTLETKCRKNGVRIHLNHEVTQNFIENQMIDTVIFSTGSLPISLQVEGINDIPNRLAHDVLKGEAINNKKILIIGGGLVGCETAEYLLQFQNHVDIVDALPELARDMNKYPRKILLNHLLQNNVHFYTSLKVKKVKNNEIIVEDNQNIEKSIGVYDEIVFAIGSYSYIPFELNKNIDHYLVGDCLQVADAGQAIYDATVLALKI